MALQSVAMTGRCQSFRINTIQHGDNGYRWVFQQFCHETINILAAQMIATGGPAVMVKLITCKEGLKGRSPAGC